MKRTTSSRIFTRLTLCAAVFSLIQCLSTTRTIMSPLQMSPYGDFLRFDSAPDTITENSIVRISYICSMACRVGIEVVLSTPKTVGRVTFRRSWTHVRPLKTPITRTIQLKFPSALVYKRDFFIRQTAEVHDGMLRAWLVYLDGEERNSSHNGVSQYERSTVRAFKSLKTVPPSERPAKSQNRCLAWGAELMWNRTKGRIGRCIFESDIVRLLTFPFASTGEKYGVIRTFPSFANRELETASIRALEKPRVTVSIWLYLLNWCTVKYCGIIKHLYEHRKYGSPLLLLTDTGKIVVQACLVSGVEKAFTVDTDLPLRTWIRLDLFIQASEVKIIITQASSTDYPQEAVYSFQDSVLYNDTSGYFVIGGCIYMPGFQGYVGPVKYYRLGSETVVNPLTPERMLTKLDQAHRWCEDVKQITKDYVTALQDNSASLVDDVCVPRYEQLRRTFVQTRCMQTWSWEHQLKYSFVFKILRRHQEELISGSWSSKKASLLAQRLYQDTVKSLADASHGDIDMSLIELLQLCSCWGHHQANLMLATLHLSGLGVPADQEKGHVYSLMGGVVDERLALLHLGYKHMQGLDGFPKDQDMAYGYYANVAKQTSIDLDFASHLQGWGFDSDLHLGNVDALNSLGWYYSTMEYNSRKAAYYFDLAARNGSRDGLFNLGVYHLNGTVLDSLGRNETAAFQCFLKAGEQGHVEGAVEAASSLSRGQLPGVRRDPEKAVNLLKPVSEKNGHLGFTIRDALKAFQHGSWDEALLKYAMLAETGFIVAQLNAAHLCEVLTHGSACQWRYHNYSTHNHGPHESGLLKMGDHYSALGDITNAVILYSRAALRGSAQGMYNLAVLTEEGLDIPANILEQMKISTEDQMNKHGVVEKLLTRCRELEGNNEEMSPCSLALIGLRVSRAWSSFTHSKVHLTLTVAALVMLALAIAAQSAIAHYSAAPPHSIPDHLSPRLGESDSHFEAQEGPSGITQSARIRQTFVTRHVRSLQETADFVFTASGLCMCALCTVFVSHVL